MCFVASYSHKNEDLHREECIEICESALGLNTINKEHDDEKPAAPFGPKIIVFNLFSLEAYHIAEALGVSCVAASPYIIPYRLQERMRTALLRIADREEHSEGSKMEFCEVRTALLRVLCRRECKCCSSCVRSINC